MRTKLNSVHVHQRVGRKCNGEWSALEDKVYNRCGVSCEVHINSERISVRTKDLPDYYLARSVIAGSVHGNLPIVRDNAQDHA